MAKSKFHYFSIEELKLIRDEVTNATSQEQLVETLDRTIKKKEDQLTKSMNSQFLVDWFNIDQDYIGILHANGIENLAQLRSIKEEDLWQLTGMTQGGFRQISWARDFFDMTPIEKIKPEKRDPMTVAKVIVKHANECSKKHPNV
jgi:hypothetical protein